MHPDFLHGTIKPMRLSSSLEQAKISKKLKGKVFHVTTLSNFELILASGAILHNQTGRFPHRGGFKNACFNKLAHVSVCDFFHNKSIPKEKYINDYNIFFDGAIFLFLHPNAFAKLMTWDQGRAKAGLACQVVPFLESGYPDKIPLSEIIDVWQIELDGSLKPDPAVIDKLRKVMERSILACQERNSKKN